MRDRNRRQVLIGTGALAAAGIGGIAVTSQNSSATVSGSYTVPDTQGVLADTTVRDIRLRADVSWSIESNAPLHAVEVELHVGANQDTLALIARSEQTDLSVKQLSGDDTLSGSILSAPVYSVDDFTPTNGELSTSVISELRLYAIRDGQQVAKAVQSDGFVVTLKDEELQVESTVSGTGEVLVETG